LAIHSSITCLPSRAERQENKSNSPDEQPVPRTFASTVT
jgi:hypothetical protein